MPSSTIDTGQLARLLDITPRHVQRLTIDGVLTRAADADGTLLRGRYTLLSIRDYCRYIRSQNRVDNESQSTWDALKNKRLAVETELASLRLKEQKGQLHQARHIEFIWTNMLTYFKQRMISIPSKVARRCVGKNFRQIYDIVSTEIELGLRELSAYSRTMFEEKRNEYLSAQGADVEGVNGETETATTKPDSDDE
jgi:hypothetical protein